MSHHMRKIFKNKINTIVRTLGEQKEARHFDRDPIIIGGCGRSGTTLLLSILAAHPEIFAIPHETVALVQWAPAFAEQEGHEHTMLPSRIDRLYRHLLVKRVPPEARCWCEKTPRNVRYLQNILQHWSESRFINIIRDPRDVLTSRHRNKPDKYWVSLNRWVQDVKAGLEFEDHSRVLTIRYEDLVQNFEASIHNLCGFLQVECVPEILNWHDHTSVRKNRSWKGKVVKLHANSVQKWKLPEHESRLNHIMKDERILDLMERLNYR